VPRALFLSNGTWSDGKTSRTWIRTTVFAHISPCSRHKDINSSEAAIQTGNGAEDDVASHLHVETLTPTLPSMPPFTSHAKPSISTIIPVVTLKDVLGLRFLLLFSLEENGHQDPSYASPFHTHIGRLTGVHVQEKVTGMLESDGSSSVWCTANHYRLGPATLSVNS
jgi:hypothetical protein